MEDITIHLFSPIEKSISRHFRKIEKRYAKDICSRLDTLQSNLQELYALIENSSKEER